jgi:hypothetical protein
LVGACTLRYFVALVGKSLVQKDHPEILSACAGQSSI